MLLITLFNLHRGLLVGQAVDTVQDNTTLENQEPPFSSLPDLVDVRETSVESLSVVQVLQSQGKKRKPCKECENCKASVPYLRAHLHRHENCATFYRELFQNESVDDIMNEMERDRFNRNRAQRRRDNRLNGVPREQRTVETFPACWKNFIQAMGNLLSIRCAFCECKFSPGPGIMKIPDDDLHLVHLLDAFPERDNGYRYENSHWRCKNCESRIKQLNGNQTLDERIKDMLCMRENDETLLIMSYESESHLHTVLFPKLKEAPNELPFTDSAKDQMDVKVMIPDKLCRLSEEDHIDPDVAELFVKRTAVDSVSLSTILYKDIDNKMRSAEDQIKTSNETTKVSLFPELSVYVYLLYVNVSRAGLKTVQYNWYKPMLLLHMFT